VSKIPSNFHVDVAWKKKSERWRTCKFPGNRALFNATGKNFETVMKETLIIGLQPDEPAP
jgi:hypothetical protein